MPKGGGIRYTEEELLHLRESPLVRKPDGLPVIEQWMEPVSDSSQRKTGRAQARIDNAFQAADTSSGQLFGSFSNKFSNSGPPGPAREPSPACGISPKFPLRFRLTTKITNEEVVLGPCKANFASSRAPSATDKDGAGAGSKSLQSRESASLNGGHRTGSTSGDATRAKSDPIWARDALNPPHADAGRPSWRDRVNTRDHRAEEVPEWVGSTDMDGHTAASARASRTEKTDTRPSDVQKPRTQKDLQAWMDMQRSGKPAEEKEAVYKPAKIALTTLADRNTFFGTWGNSARQEGAATTEILPPRPAAPQESKFAKFFSPSPPEDKQALHDATTSPETQSNPGETDEGFERILQMLRVTPQHQPQDDRSTGSPRSSSVLSSPFHATAPERDPVPLQPQPSRHPLLRSREDKKSFIDSVLAPRGPPTEFVPTTSVTFGPFSQPSAAGLGQVGQLPRLEGMGSPDGLIQPAMATSTTMTNFDMQPLHSSLQAATHGFPPQNGESLASLITQPPRTTPSQTAHQRQPHNGVVNHSTMSHAKTPPSLYNNHRYPPTDVRFNPTRRMPDRPEIENAMRRAGRFNLPIHSEDNVGLPRDSMASMGILQHGQYGQHGQHALGDQMWSTKSPRHFPSTDRSGISMMPPPPGFHVTAGGPRTSGYSAPNMPPYSAGNTTTSHPGFGTANGHGLASGAFGPSPNFNQSTPHNSSHTYFPPQHAPAFAPNFGPSSAVMLGPMPHNDHMQNLANNRYSLSGPSLGVGATPSYLPPGISITSPRGSGPSEFQFNGNNTRRSSQAQSYL